MQQKIVFIGGPGTGKTSVLNQLIERNYYAMPEISREIILEAKKQGIDQLFVTKPLLFSKLLLEKREQQFLEATKTKEKIVFFDRGIPDIQAYLSFSNTKIPKLFLKKSTSYTYNTIFHFSPWKEIHTTDNERYETFEQTKMIDNHLIKTYTSLGYTIINVPFGSLEQRANFIIHSIAYNL